MGVVRSMVLYGAPVWSNDLAGASSCKALLRSLQRLMAIRVVRGYRTILFEAATVLARHPPFDILADMDAMVYDQVRSVGRNGEEAAPDHEPGMLRRNAHTQALRAWQARLVIQGCASQRAVGAVLPSFEAWVGRNDCVTYRLTQMLTGHGCFGEYLNRIGREATAQCHHCGSDRDSAQHTLEDCPAWESERRVLVGQIGRNLSPPALIAAMLASGEGWAAAVSFCEDVMLQKEAAERDR
ncbi:unnamed protein product [Arctia plantaginis]|uniref:Reverse transcriptase n=1 Tax=Arctia plantaginis TaxID=874455 RepID=A0A8S0YQ51_ARCPL|nr:unnamed protein product [Arctia plantaginis]